MNKNIKRVTVVLLIAVIIELGIFNFSFFQKVIEPNLKKNITYTIDEIKKINWINEQGSYISQSDPMLFIESINSKVNTIEITMDMDTKIPFMMIYYIDNDMKNFNDKMSIAITENITDKITIKIDHNVKDLRIDLGDNKGSKLNNITVIINPTKLDFSISRVVAIIFIYFTGTFLFSLQKNLDYNF